MSEKIPMTAGGFSRLQEELQQLKIVERPNIIQAISDARAHGDLSENAEYHSARERQGFIEGRIKDLETKLSRAEVIDTSKLKGHHVRFGANISLVDEETDEETQYQIVGVDEADIEKNLISISSPLARALIGREEGDSVNVKTPNGTRSYEILKVEFK